MKLPITLHYYYASKLWSDRGGVYESGALPGLEKAAEKLIRAKFGDKTSIEWRI